MLGTQGWSSLPVQIQVVVVEVQLQRVLAVSAKLSRDADVAVIGVIGRIYAHADNVGAGPHGQCERDRPTAYGHRFAKLGVGMRITASTQLVMIPQIAVDPDVDLSRAKRILPDDLPIRRQRSVE